jgi:hypothetical protein
MKEMKNKVNRTNQPLQQADKVGKTDLPGYPLYPASEDIFIRCREEGNISPEDTSKQKESGEYDKAGERSEKEFADYELGRDLDVPGSELDDEQESIGNEDEENNYYSLGGDGHSDLEEEQGD